MKKSPLHLQGITPKLVSLLEILGFLSLLGTGEISATLILIFLALSVIQFPFLKNESGPNGRLLVGQRPRFNFNFNLNDKWLFPGFMILVLVGATLFLRYRIHPLIVSGYVVHGLFLLLWLSRPTLRQFAWRSASSFMVVLISISLTPDFYLAGVLFVFMILGALTLSALFMSTQFQIHDEKLLLSPLPSSFIWTNILVASVIFIASLVIFPILPRTTVHMGMSFGVENRGKVAFTDRVSLLGLSDLMGTGEGEIALSVFIQSNTEIKMPSYWFHKGLLRTRTLDRFDGTTWKPLGSKQYGVSPNGNRYISKIDIPIGVYSKFQSDLIVLEFLREPLQFGLIPTPYGVKSIDLSLTEPVPPVIQLRGREWISPQTADRKAQYKVAVGRGQFPDDPPLPLHQEVPEFLLTSKIHALSKELFNGLKTEREKVQAVASYFSKEKFKPSTQFASKSGFQSLPTTLTESERTKAALEMFLFDQKEGHCELFSSATAFLLRMAGVPTRLISGFKVSRDAVGGVFTLRQGDAHAWVEVWNSERESWSPVDLTPVQISSQNSLLAQFRGIKESLSAQWFRYIVKYSPQQQSTQFKQLKNLSWGELKEWVSEERYLSRDFFEAMLPTFFLLVGFGVLILAYRHQKFRLGRSSRMSPHLWNAYVPKPLRKRRKILTKISKKSLDENQKEILAKITYLDERIRFGNAQENDVQYEQLDKYLGEFK